MKPADVDFDSYEMTDSESISESDCDSETMQNKPVKRVGREWAAEENLLRELKQASE